MNCQRFESIANELARNQMMEAEVREQALAHSAECASCSARLRKEEALTRGLHSLSLQMNSLEPPVSLEARLLSAFRQPQVVVPFPVVRDYRRHWMTAVAALILIVFSVVAVRLRETRIETPKQTAGNEQPSNDRTIAAVADSSPASKSAELETPKSSAPMKRRFVGNASSSRGVNNRRTDNNVLANHVTTEVATEFMPLGYLNPATLQDGGQIVRVEVPRTTLASFGVPVNMDRYNEKVKADILLGVDGTARAIRFVQDKRLQ